MENKIVKKLIDLNAYLTFECSDLTTEEYKGVSKRIEEITNDVLNMHIVSRKFKDKEAKNFIEWYLSEGYIPTERTGVYKNGCNIILGEDLYLKYTESIKVKP